jgi:hypothetical protein
MAKNGNYQIPLETAFPVLPNCTVGKCGQVHEPLIKTLEKSHFVIFCEELLTRKTIIMKNPSSTKP